MVETLKSHPYFFLDEGLLFKDIILPHTKREHTISQLKIDLWDVNENNKQKIIKYRKLIFSLFIDLYYYIID